MLPVQAVLLLWFAWACHQSRITAQQLGEDEGRYSDGYYSDYYYDYYEDIDDPVDDAYLVSAHADASEPLRRDDPSAQGETVRSTAIEPFEAETVAAFDPRRGLFEAAAGDSGTSQQTQRKYGFKKSSGSGIKKSTAPLVNAKRLEEIAMEFGCFLKKNAGAQRVLDPSLRAKEAVMNRTAEQQSVSRRGVDSKEAE